MKAEICQKILDGFCIPDEWALRIVVPIFKRKGDIRNCSCNRAVTFLEHCMKVVVVVELPQAPEEDPQKR